MEILEIVRPWDLRPRRCEDGFQRLLTGLLRMKAHRVKGAIGFEQTPGCQPVAVGLRQPRARVAPLIVHRAFGPREVRS